MEILNKKILDDFQRKHVSVRSAIQSWLAEASSAKWKDTSTIKKRYSTASFLSDNIVIFNLKGNSYRLEVKIAYNSETVLIKWAGTHTEYDKRNKKATR